MIRLLKKNLLLLATFIVISTLLLASVCVIESLKVSDSVYGRLTSKDKCVCLSISGAQESDFAALTAISDLAAIYKLSPYSDVVSAYYIADVRSVPPLISGRYLKSGESADNRVAIVGRNVLKDCRADGEARLYSYGFEAYEVAGVMGNDGRRSAFDDLAIISLSASLAGDYASLNGDYIFEFQGIAPGFIELSSELSAIPGSGNASITALPRDSIYPNFIGLSVSNGIMYVALCALLLALINAFTMTSNWIYERRKKIGIYKACGATDMRVALGVFGEFQAVALVGFIISSLIIYIARGYLESVFGLVTDYIDWRAPALCYALCACMGVLAALPAVLHALKIPPNLAMR